MTPVQTIETDETRTQTFPGWVEKNTRWVGVGAALVAVAAAGYWFYLRSAEIKRLNAERGLNQAKQSLAAGNAALAQTDLQRVATRYKGTPAGAQSAILLAQVHFEQGKYAEGVQVLEPYQTSAASGSSLAAIWSLTGDGQLAQGKADEAAKAYRNAGEATTLKGERSLYLARAARALMAAGKNGDARTLWQELADDPDAVAVHNEASVRLGELTAQPAGKT